MDASPDTIRSEMVALLPRLRRFALSLTGNRADGEDLAQETVERALNHLRQWQSGTRLDSWMFRIAQNLFIDERRSAKRKRDALAEAVHMQAASVQDGARDAEARLTWKETCAALATLPAEQRSAVALVLIDGMSYREAAAVLGVPIGTLTSRLARGRDALATRIFGSGEDLRP
ncbi:MAG TPA: RNA polymerase sigma factor [Rhizomicrobium sp.]|nr:RNA polymerase sigma factor [Rhizomicrobium sp.]